MQLNRKKPVACMLELIRQNIWCFLGAMLGTVMMVLISFATPVLGSTYDNPNAGDNQACDVFHGSGGGLTYYGPQTEWLTIDHQAQTHYGQWFFTPSSYVAGFGKYGTGAGACVDSNECWELIMGLPYITYELCTAINRKLAFGAPDGTPPRDTGASFAQSGSIPFQGVYPTTGSEMGNATPSFYSNTVSGCIEGASNPPTGSYHFFTVLLAR